MDGSSVPLSPDCRVGSHRACTGDAWDHVADGPAVCPCECHGETGEG